MKYMLLIYSAEAAPADPAAGASMLAAYGAYSEALKQAGALLGADRLQPSANATTVRISDGHNEVLNGPYAETREQLGGYFLIEAPDLDVALKWAARCPGASHGIVEVRPIWAMG